MQNKRVVWLAVFIGIVFIFIIALTAVIALTPEVDQTAADGVDSSNGHLNGTHDSVEDDQEPLVPTNAKDLNQNEI